MLINENKMELIINSTTFDLKKASNDTFRVIKKLKYVLSHVNKKMPWPKIKDELNRLITIKNIKESLKDVLCENINIQTENR